MTIRKFNCENGNMVVSNDGDYIHTNDLELYLITARNDELSYIEQSEDKTDSYTKERVEKSREIIRFIDRTLKKFNL